MAHRLWAYQTHVLPHTENGSPFLQIDLSVDQQTPVRILVDVSAHWASSIVIGASRDGRSNFDGCLKKLELTSSGLFLDFVRIAKSDMGLLTANGSVDFKCQPAGASSKVTGAATAATAAGRGRSPLSQASKKSHKEHVVSFLTPESFVVSGQLVV